MDLAFSHKKRGKDLLQDADADVASRLFLLSSIVVIALVFLSFNSGVDSLFASFGAVEPKTQEELQASKRWHVSFSC